MKQPEFTRSKEYKTIGDRADAITRRAIQHHNQYKDIFVYKEAKRLKNSTELKNKNYQRSALENVEIRIQQRLDRISTGKNNMQERFVKKNISKDSKNNEANQKEMKQKRSFGSFAKDLFGKAPVGKQSPPAVDTKKQKLVTEYTPDGAISRKTEITSSKVSFQNKVNNKTSEVITASKKDINYKNGKEQSKTKKKEVRREYTIGGTIERQVHSSVERNYERNLNPSPDVERPKTKNISKPFNRVRSMT